MLLILGAITGAAALAAYTYLGRERLGVVGAGLAALRWAAISVLVLLLVDPPWLGGGRPAPPVILLDRSLSMGVPGGHWTEARDTAAQLAGASGRVLGFGRTVGPIVDSLPEGGASRLREALAAARAAAGAVWVVTDGEITDAAAIPPSQLDGVGFVVLPRDTVPGAALAEVRVPPVVRASDSIPVAATVVTWGGLPADSVHLRIRIDGRHLAHRAVPLPEPPATVQRLIAVPSRGLAAGDHALEIELYAEGDVETRDNVREWPVSVVPQPPLVVIADPAGWEGRFVFETFEAVSGMPTQGFARIGADRWVDLATSATRTDAEVRSAAAEAALLIIEGSDAVVRGMVQTRAVWRWAPEGQAVAGEWYVEPDVPPSPLSGALTRVEWDSVPPLTGVRPVPHEAGLPVLLARQSRRGSPQPVVVSSTEADHRELRTVAEGFSRWALRGGASREALRTLVAAGTDWLLRTTAAGAGSPLRSDRTVARNLPVSFRWSDGAVPDSVSVVLTSDGGSREALLRFDATGRAGVFLPPAVYRWRAADVGARGTVAVESYSGEFPPAPVAFASRDAATRAMHADAEHVRDRWWIYLLALLALCAEWAWRQRRGLP